jgi:hypothetical protein
VSLKLRNTEAARGYYLDGLAIAKRLAAADRKNKGLAAADPQSAQAQRDLSISYGLLGDVNLQLGNAEAARGYYLDGLAIAKRLAAADRKNVEAQTDLFISYFKLGSVCRETHQYGRARHWFARALQVVEPLDQQGKLKGTPFARAVAHMKQQIAFCQAAEKAIADLVLRARSICGRGHHTVAAATADKLAGLDARNGPNLYNAACCYSLCVAAVAHGRQPAEVSAADRALQEDYAARAMQLLRQARQAGYFKARPNVAHLGKDPDLDPLRSRPDFQALLAELAK